MKYIEDQSVESTFNGLFSEINLSSEKLGKTYTDRNAALCKIITEISTGLKSFSTDSDTLGDAYEYLIAQFADWSGKKAGECPTPQFVSAFLSQIVALAGQQPAHDHRRHSHSMHDLTCGTVCSLLTRCHRKGGQAH